MVASLGTRGPKAARRDVLDATPSGSEQGGDPPSLLEPRPPSPPEPPATIWTQDARTETASTSIGRSRRIAVDPARRAILPSRTPDPRLYEINTRVLLAELGRGLQRKATLDDIPDSMLDRIAKRFDWVWLLGAWQTGIEGQDLARKHPGVTRDCRTALPDLRDEDIVSSPFAIKSYDVDEKLGGRTSLERLRWRLRQRGVKLMLDFVANHTAVDHPWVFAHPEFYIRGSGDRTAFGHASRRVDTRLGTMVLAQAKDPYFAPWTDALQLNYRHAGLRTAMVEELSKISEQCDGVRCDMSMLLLPDVIKKTWKESSAPSDGSKPVDDVFWREATRRVRERSPDFKFLAEVYWNREWDLQQLGFDYTYDKRLYDRLRAHDAKGIRAHLGASSDFQQRMARFIENHDEPRAAAAFGHTKRAAAVIAYLVPGMKLFHDGQLEGRRIRTPMQLERRQEEDRDCELAHFYDRLIACCERPEAAHGRFRSIEPRQAWDKNRTFDHFIAFTLEGDSGNRLLVTVNYGPTQGQCYVPLPWSDLKDRKVILRDLLSLERHVRQGSDLVGRGLYLDLSAWGYHVFELSACHPDGSVEAPADPRRIRISNFHAVEVGKIYRSGRVTHEGLLDAIRTLGLRTVISLEDHPETVRKEQALVEGLGLAFESFPVQHHAIQNHEDVMRILEAISKPENQPALIHCAEGMDRTGMVIGIHRVLNQSWRRSDAFEEMLEHGFHRKFTALEGHFQWETRGRA
jgi:protein tyrosine phosphatase (PTP) superfamily phosphohydrolase (DUF442 family)